MAVDKRQLLNCLGHFATGVTVVTCARDELAHGATVNAFAAVSLDPPLVLVSLDRDTKACRVLEGNPFTVNMLRDEQEDLALHFAGRAAARLVRWAPRNGNLAPRLANVLAYLACTPWRSYDGGDHTLFLGRVEEFAYFGGEPLLFFRGRFARRTQEFEVPPWIGSLDSLENGWLVMEPAN
jgi:flavin reductase (DIM6/NTAB) family NADH-FMN oxidoreductase RutF